MPQTPAGQGGTASSFRRGLFRAMSLAAGIFIAALMLELVLRMGFLQPAFDMGGLKIVMDSRILFKIAPSCRADINARGFRGPAFSPAARGKKRVLFMGDSFVFGVNVEEQDSMPAVLRRFLGQGYEVLNMGVQGYGPDQSLIQLEDAALSWEPDKVILALYPTNDFADMEKNKLFRLDAQGGLERVSPTLTSPLFPRWRTAALFSLIKRRFMPRGETEDVPDPFDPESYRKLFYSFFRDSSDRDFIDIPDSEKARDKKELMRAVLQRFRDLLKERGIDFFVIVLPAMENVQLPEVMAALGIPPEKYFTNEDMAVSILKELGIPHVNLYRLFLPRRDRTAFFDVPDGHLSREGYRYVARFLNLYVRALEP
jgi:lysophospholipase L1-like esterase